MATKEDLKGARELVDLDVREVSLVDRPANLREFLVAKRMEDNMGVFETEYDGGVDPSQVAPGLAVTKAKDAGSTKQEGGQLTDDMKAAVKEVMDWMKKAAKNPGAPTESIGKVAPLLAKLLAGQSPYPTPQTAQKNEGGAPMDVSKAKKTEEDE